MPARRLERSKRCRLRPIIPNCGWRWRFSRAQKNPRDPMLIEALKMSYFTAPNDARLMAVRLDLATSSNALADPDLKELARGDVRLILLTRQPD